MKIDSSSKITQSSALLGMTHHLPRRQLSKFHQSVPSSVNSTRHCLFSTPFIVVIVVLLCDVVVSPPLLFLFLSPLLAVSLFSVRGIQPIHNDHDCSYIRYGGCCCPNAPHTSPPTRQKINQLYLPK